MEAATEDILVMVTLIFMSAETEKGSPAIPDYVDKLKTGIHHQCNGLLLRLRPKTKHVGVL